MNFEMSSGICFLLESGPKCFPADDSFDCFGRVDCVVCRGRSCSVRVFHFRGRGAGFLSLVVGGIVAGVTSAGKLLEAEIAQGKTTDPFLRSLESCVIVVMFVVIFRRSLRKNCFGFR